MDRPTLQDALTALKISTGRLPFDPRYDVTGDGKVTTEDYIGLQKAYLGKDPGFAFAENTFVSPSTKTAEQYAAEEKANQERIAAEQKETARRQALLSDAQKLNGLVSADLVANNPNLNAQQLASLAQKNYWSKEAPAFGSLMSAMENGTAQVKNVQIDNEYSELQLISPDGTSVPLRATPQEGVYQFSVYNPTAGGTITSVIQADPATGKYKPIADYTKQTQYTPGGSGGFFGGLVSSLGSMIADLGPIGQIGLAYLTAGLGSAIAEELVASQIVSSAASDAVGNAIAKTVIDVAQGKDLGESLTNSIVNAVVQTGTPDIAKTISTVVENKDIANVLTSAVSSAGSTLLKGGDLQDAITSAVAGATGTGVAEVTDSTLAGTIAANLSTGQDLNTAITNAVTKMAVADAKKTSEDTITDVTATDTVTGAGGQDTVTSTVDTVTGTQGQDTISAVTDTVAGVTGQDTVSAVADTVTGGQDTTAGGADTISTVVDTVTGGVDTLTGATGLDLIQQVAQDSIVGGEATTQGAVGVDTITGGQDTGTTLTGDNSDEVVAGTQQLIDAITNPQSTVSYPGTQVADAGRAGDPGSGVYWDSSIGAWRVADEATDEDLEQLGVGVATGTDGVDTLTGATGLDLIQQTGQDSVVGGEATTQGAAGVDTIVGGADTDVGATGVDTVSATVDTITGEDDVTDQQILDLIRGGESTTQGSTAEDTIIPGEAVNTGGIDVIDDGTTEGIQDVIDTIVGVGGEDTVSDDGTTQDIQQIIDTYTIPDTISGSDVNADADFVPDNEFANYDELYTIPDTPNIDDGVNEDANFVADDEFANYDELYTIPDTVPDDVNEDADFVGSLGDESDLPAVDEGGSFGNENEIPPYDSSLDNDTSLFPDEGVGLGDDVEIPPVDEDFSPEEPVVPEDTTTQPFIVSTKRTKAPADSTYLLGTVLQQPSSLAQSLTSYRGAGELESKTTGKPRKNVWNEASLRLKDALGL